MVNSLQNPFRAWTPLDWRVYYDRRFVIQALDRDDSYLESPYVAVITGAGGDIGRAIARALLVRPEIQCALVDQEQGHASGLVDEYGPERVLEVVADVTDPELANDRTNVICKWRSPIKMLVNAAGITYGSPSLDYPPDMWRRVLDVHLSGTFFWCQAVARRMAEAGVGSIVNLSSVAAYVGYPFRVPYGAAKAAINSVTQTLAVEWAQYGIRVNGVAPGYINTSLARLAINEGWIDEDFARSLHAADRFGEVEEVAAAVLFLLSDDASFISGETLRVDGGFLSRKIT